MQLPVSMNPRLVRILAFAGLIMSVFLFLRIYVTYSQISRHTYKSSDIASIWNAGHDLCKGRSPYARMKKEGKNGKPVVRAPIYLPGAYILICAVEKLGYNTHKKWQKVWEPALVVLHIAIGVMLFILLFEKGHPALAFFVILFWLFSRFSIQTLVTRQTNTLALFPLLLSLAFINTRRTASLLLFGFSLVLKQVAVFLAPLYLVWCWNDRKSWSDFRRSVFLILIIPFAATLPFIIRDYESFFMAIFYPTMHLAPGGYAGYPAAVRSIHPALPTILMLVSMALVYLAALRRRLPEVTAALLVMMCFIAFNNIIFSQYFLWFFALVPIALLDWVHAGDRCDRM